MADNRTDGDGFGGQVQSPAGFVFGVQGWNWGDPRPRSITFFLDNTAKVSDQWGRPIKGTVQDGVEVRFADTPPIADQDGTIIPRPQFATHARVVAALAAERVDWRTLVCAGWPQLPYDLLKQILEDEKVSFALPPTPIEELQKIRDKKLRKDALRLRLELDELRERELQVENE